MYLVELLDSIDHASVQIALRGLAVVLDVLSEAGQETRLLRDVGQRLREEG